MNKIHGALVDCEKGQTERPLAIVAEFSEQYSNDIVVQMQLGTLCIKLGEISEAINHLTYAVNLDSDNVKALMLLGVAYLEASRLNQSLGILSKALSLEPDNFDVNVNLGKVYLALRLELKAVEVLQKAAKQKPRDEGATANLAIALKQLGRYEEAIKFANKALTVNPSNSLLWHLLGRIYFETGDIDKATINYNKAITKDKKMGYAYLDLAQTRKFSADDNKTVQKYENSLKAELPIDQRALIMFALGKIHDDRKDWDRAFDCYRQANLLKKNIYDHKRLIKSQKQINSFFNKNLVNDHSLSGSNSTKPIFIVGMPRSGTTLVEQILSSNRDVSGAGELPNISVAFIESFLANGDKGFRSLCQNNLTPERLAKLASDYIESLTQGREGSKRVVDKMPENYLYLGFIRILFPNAKIIHAIRDPIDTCLSCYFQPFTDIKWSFDLEWIGERYQFYHRQMKTWEKVLPEGSIFPVRYENLIEDPENNIRSMLEFCELDWDPSCLEFNLAKSAVRTASIWQVRQPIYRSSMQRWVNYASHLGPLVKPLTPMLSQADKDLLKKNGINISSRNKILELFS